MDEEDLIHPSVTRIARRKLGSIAASGIIVAAGELLLARRSLAAGRDSAGDERRRGGRRHRHRRSRGLFRDSALTVVNKTDRTLTCAFYFRPQSGGDDYGLPVLALTQAVAAGASFRYAPEQFRVGVLVKEVDPAVDLYADVRNRSLGYPRGGVTSGAQLDPASGNLGNAFIPEQGYSQGEQHKRAKIVLKRRDDAQDFIEWELTVGQSREG